MTPSRLLVLAKKYTWSFYQRKTLRRDYCIPLTKGNYPTDEETEAALIHGACRKVKAVYGAVGDQYRETAAQLAKEIGAEAALSRALFLLSKVERPTKVPFEVLPKSVKARLARKEKIQAREKAVAAKKKKIKRSALQEAEEVAWKE